ncbi:hypothetical protein GUJ93_ZPchr0575g29176, partial [Zizania palustris]
PHRPHRLVGSIASPGRCPGRPPPDHYLRLSSPKKLTNQKIHSLLSSCASIPRRRSSLSRARDSLRFCSVSQFILPLAASLCVTASGTVRASCGGRIDGKKRVAPASAAPPVFPFPEAADDEPRHFSDYGFEDNPRLRFFYNAEATRPAAARRQQQQPLESARFKLQKLISKKPTASSSSSAAGGGGVPLPPQRSSSSSAAPTIPPPPSPPPLPPLRPTALPCRPSWATVPRQRRRRRRGSAACTCWAPAMRSGHHLATRSSAPPLPCSPTSASGRTAAAPEEDELRRCPSTS